MYIYIYIYIHAYTYTYTYKKKYIYIYRNANFQFGTCYLKYMEKKKHKSKNISLLFRSFINVIYMYVYISGLYKLCAQARKTSEVCLIFWVHTFCLVKKKKPLHLQISSEIDNTVKMLLNSKYYCEHKVYFC